MRSLVSRDGEGEGVQLNGVAAFAISGALADDRVTRSASRVGWSQLVQYRRCIVLNRVALPWSWAALLAP